MCVCVGGVGVGGGGRGEAYFENDHYLLPCDII